MIYIYVCWYSTYMYILIIDYYYAYFCCVWCLCDVIGINRQPSVCVCVPQCVCVLLVVCRSCGGCQDRGFLRNKAWQAQLGMVWKELAKIGKPHVNTHLQLCLFVTVNFVAIHTRTQYRNRLKLGNLNRLFLQCMIDYHLNTFCPPWTPIWRARE